MDHSTFLDDLEASAVFIKRTKGQFYTPQIIGQHLASQAVQHSLLDPISRELKLVDPFAGDGRLVIWLLECLMKSGMLQERSVHVHLWERDADALERAKDNVLDFSKTNYIDINVIGLHTDTFRLAAELPQSFDIVITNPPWDVLKPDSSYSKYLATPEAERTFRSRMLLRSKELLNWYPSVRPAGGFSSVGISLASCGIDVAMRLTKHGGICAFVSPLSMLADQRSVTLRLSLISNFCICDIGQFSAEGRFFKGVDQDSATVVARRTPVETSSISLHHSTNPSSIDRTGTLTESTKTLLRKSRLPVPYYARIENLIDRWVNLPRFCEIEKPGGPVWAGRELDETRYSTFTTSSGRYKFVKGRMITRYSGIQESTLYVDETKKNIPESADRYRIAWRDVSRPSQQRRMIATILPPQHVSGNSLNVMYFEDGKESLLLPYLCIFNSFVFEIQIRLLLSTAHISLGTVRRVCVPYPLDKDVSQLLTALCTRRLNGDTEAERDIEIAVAKLMGLSKSQFADILTLFNIGASSPHMSDSSFWNRMHIEPHSKL